VASVSRATTASRDLGDACVPVVGVRTVTDRQTSGAPLVDQSGDAVQTDHTFHVGAIDAGASERIGQVLSREVTTAEVLSRIVNWHACRIARCPSTGGRVASWLGVPPTPVPTGGCVPAFSGGCRHGGGTSHHDLPRRSPPRLPRRVRLASSSLPRFENGAGCGSTFAGPGKWKPCLRMASAVTYCRSSTAPSAACQTCPHVAPC